MRLKLLISSTDEKESAEAVAGGADIIDVKNPNEGALGANFPWVIRRIRETTPINIEVSCALGDVPKLFGTVSLAALGAATTGANYIKTGLYGVKTQEEAVYLMKNVTRAVKDYDSKIKVVATGYADAIRVGSVSPLLIPEIAHKAETDLVMVDTLIKDGETLFAFLTNSQLQQFVKQARNYGLGVALAGSLRKEDISAVHALGADIVGLRAAACTAHDRVNGRITRENVRELADTIASIEKKNVP
jgi:uncharacterized protein (UPF0264 family)